MGYQYNFLKLYRVTILEESLNVKYDLSYLKIILAVSDKHLVVLWVSKDRWLWFWKTHERFHWNLIIADELSFD